MAAPQGKKGAELIGQVLDNRYRVLDTLGSGGFGLVLKVEHLTLKKVQALKLLHRAASDNPKLITRFEREARSTANLGHEHIIDISDFGEDPQHGHYFVMEFLDGLPLDVLIKNEGAMPARRVLHIVKQVCDALSVVHAEAIIHRDLKPANIFVLQRPRKPDFVKVLDFGIAAMKLGEGEERLTQAGMVLGSPSYMSPEQALGKELDARSDLYALGIITYQMLAGRVPFQAQSDLMVIRKHLREPPPPLSEVRSDLHVPPNVEAIVMRLLEKSPNARFQSADELLDAIEAVENVVVDAPGVAAPVVGTGPQAIPRRPTAVPAAAPVPTPMPAPAAPRIAAPGAAPVDSPKTVPLMDDEGPAAPLRPRPPQLAGRPSRPSAPSLPVQSPVAAPAQPPVSRAAAPAADDLDGPATVLVNEDAPRPVRPVPPPIVGRGRSHAIKPLQAPPPASGPLGGGGAPAPGNAPDESDLRTMALGALPLPATPGPRPGASPVRPPVAAPPAAAVPQGTLGADMDDDDEGVIKTQALGAVPHGGPLPGRPQAPAAAAGSLGGDEEEDEAFARTMALGAMPPGRPAPAPAPPAAEPDLQEARTMALDVSASRAAPAPAPADTGDEQERRTMFLDPSPSQRVQKPHPPQSGPLPQAPAWQTGQRPANPQQQASRQQWQPNFGPGGHGTMEMVREVKKASSTQRILFFILIPALLIALTVLIYLILE